MDSRHRKVSVIVPVYNGAQFIEETIHSVINQSYKNWELLLIDDGSEDNSVDIINKYTNDEKIHLIQHPGRINLGVSKTRELGIKKAKGNYISFLDADDIFYTDKLRNQLEIFSKIEDVILIHSKVEILNNSELEFNNEFEIDKKDKVYKLREQESWMTHNKICNSTVMVKSHILKEIRFGLPQIFQFEDWLLWTLLAEKGKFYYQNEPQIQYRIHSSSSTAGILRNKLIIPYSKIEYLISLYALSKSTRDNEVIIKRLKETIIELFECYSKDNRAKADSFELNLKNLEGTSEEYFKKYKDLSIKLSRVQKRLNELNTIKNSTIFKIIKKLKTFSNWIKGCLGKRENTLN